MLTIFACPKPFTNSHTAIIQRNAITSWTLLRPKPEIILFGDDEGTAEICQELALQHAPEVARNEFGTPLLNDIFEKAQSLAIYDLLCYVNADIIFMRDFVDGVKHVTAWNDYFLATGARWNLERTNTLDFTHSAWEQELTVLVKEKGELQSLAADYFVFPRGFYKDIPPFAIGRTAFDNWLLWRARHLQAPIVDLSPVVFAIHQNHWTTSGLANLYRLPETKSNMRLAGYWKRSFNLFDTTHQLTSCGITGTILRSYKNRVNSFTQPLTARMYSMFWRLGLRRSALRRFFKF